MTDQKQFLTVSEAADLARVTTRTIRNWINKGAIRAVHPTPNALKRLIPREDVDPKGAKTLAK